MSPIEIRRNPQPVRVTDCAAKEIFLSRFQGAAPAPSIYSSRWSVVANATKTTGSSASQCSQSEALGSGVGRSADA